MVEEALHMTNAAGGGGIGPGTSTWSFNGPGPLVKLPAWCLCWIFEREEEDMLLFCRELHGHVDALAGGDSSEEEEEDDDDDDGDNGSGHDGGAGGEKGQGSREEAAGDGSSGRHLPKIHRPVHTFRM